LASSDGSIFSSSSRFPALGAVPFVGTSASGFALGLDFALGFALALALGLGLGLGLGLAFARLFALGLRDLLDPSTKMTIPALAAPRQREPQPGKMAAVPIEKES
jgi:hypothetical protein